MKKYNWSLERVQEAVSNNYCYADVLRELEIPVRGRNADTLKSKIKEYNIDTSHFTFVSKNKGKNKIKPIEEYLVKNSNIKSSKLKEKLIKAGLKQNRCECCGITSWLDKPIICQLHHIDGDESNNELSNLQMLCPNCHSQTENYCGSANKSDKVKYYCSECGRELKTNSKLCLSCASKHRRTIDWENQFESLKQYIAEGKTNIEIAEKYSVSETTIRKYRKKFKL